MIETIPLALAELSLVLIGAAIGGHFARRLGQPAVLGELFVGVLLAASVALFPDTPVSALLEEVRQDESYVALLAELGLVLLLFEVGLETRFETLIGTGWTALRVALLGVVLPFGFGALVSMFMGRTSMASGDLATHLFVGASLAATSVGLTARVFRELGKLDTEPARIVLAAAVLDDVFGLVLLAVVSGVATGAAAESGLGVVIGFTALKAAVFLGAAVFIGRRVAPRMFGWMAKLRGRGLVVTTSMAFCFASAWLAHVVGLAPIVGAFVAGLVLDDAHLRPFGAKSTVGELERQLTPVSELFVPVFFVYVGLCMDLGSVFDAEVVTLALILTLVAIVGKLACGLVSRGGWRERMIVGLGMVPRGEVGLIFATIGEQLGVLDQQLYGAVILMVVATTAISPPLLKRALVPGSVGG